MDDALLQGNGFVMLSVEKDLCRCWGEKDSQRYEKFTRYLRFIYASRPLGLFLSASNNNATMGMRTTANKQHHHDADVVLLLEQQQQQPSQRYRRRRRDPCGYTPKMLFFLILLALIVVFVHGGDQMEKDNINKPHLPILVMGLPKSGAESIYHFFECMNVKVSHYCCDDSKRITARTQFPCATTSCAECLHQQWTTTPQTSNTSSNPFHQCGNYQVFTGIDQESSEPSFSWFLPQHFALPLLHETTGLWILNTRSSWATHILHWFSVTRRLLHAFSIPYDDTTDETSITVAPTRERSVDEWKQAVQEQQQQKKASSSLQKDHTRRLEALQKVYAQHTQKVKSFAQTYNHPLLHIHVDDPHTGVQLAHALQMKDIQKAQACWSFDANKKDWNDFTLPF